MRPTNFITTFNRQDPSWALAEFILKNAHLHLTEHLIYLKNYLNNKKQP
jgi:hypothetical protein